MAQEIVFLASATHQSIIKVVSLGVIGFFVAFLIAKYFTIPFLYRYKFWRKQVREKSLDNKPLEVFKKFHSEGEVKTPRGAGIIFWLTMLLVSGFIWIMSYFDVGFFPKLEFVSRSQTWLLFAGLFFGSLIGFLDDVLQIRGVGRLSEGLSVKLRIGLVSLFGIVGGWWFFEKLNYSTIFIPFIGDVFVGWLLIPIFLMATLFSYVGGVVDGIDGLGGGSFGFIIAAFAGIALIQGQIDLAAFLAVLFGSILAFLWFNIPPAKFYMGETGSMGLTIVIAVSAFLTDSAGLLPIIGILLLVEGGSVVLQILSKKIRKKKIWLAAPLHLHLEAKGWLPHQITMRFWLIGLVFGLLGIAIKSLSLI
ncbi:Phospho-N-acetylmuramoyl-pentapeptide-transferase [bacterium HR34]|nr:Phospho-N-acetylmuramoyl-pentapeptide-transferase [bacterium HR34]